MARAKRGPGRPPAHESHDRFESILDAALTQFAARGYAATTLSAIAEDAGVSVAALYYYVDGKATLFQTVYERTVKHVWEVVLASYDARGPGPSLHERLDTLMEAVLDSGVSDSSLVLLSMAPGEFRVTPELRHLSKSRDRERRAAIRHVLEGVDGQSEIPPTLVLIVNMLITGWGLENYYASADERADLKRAWQEMARALSVGFSQGTWPSSPSAADRTPPLENPDGAGALSLGNPRLR